MRIVRSPRCSPTRCGASGHHSRRSAPRAMTQTLLADRGNACLAEGFCLPHPERTNAPTSNNQECVAEALLADYKRLKAQAEKKKVWNKEFKRKKRAQTKVEVGMNPTVHRNAAKREGETNAEHAARMERNQRNALRMRNRRKAMKDGTLIPRPKLTREELLRKRADKKAAWRAAKKQALALQASAE